MVIFFFLGLLVDWLHIPAVLSHHLQTNLAHRPFGLCIAFLLFLPRNNRQLSTQAQTSSTQVLLRRPCLLDKTCY